jgi:hypothetical protein
LLRDPAQAGALRLAAAFYLLRRAEMAPGGA